MTCNHDYILITFDYISLKIIYKPFIRFNTMYDFAKTISFWKHQFNKPYSFLTLLILY